MTEDFVSNQVSKYTVCLKLCMTGRVSPKCLCLCSTNGKTKCKRTIDSYDCVCGDGYVASDNGQFCLKIKQCLASHHMHLKLCMLQN